MDETKPSVAGGAEVNPSGRPAGSAQKAGQVVSGFSQFISGYGILPLAIGVVIGNAVNDLVKSLVEGLISPAISLIAPQQKLQNLQIIVGSSTFKIGLVINAVISFIVIALCVYLVAKLILRNEEVLKKK